MLPAADAYLTESAYQPATAAYMLIALFILGVAIIQLFSSFVHRYIPSSVIGHSHSHHLHSDAGVLSGETPHEHHPHHGLPGHPYTEEPNRVAEDTPLLASGERHDRLRSRLSNSIRSFFAPNTCDDGVLYTYSHRCAHKLPESPSLCPPPTVNEPHDVPGMQNQVNGQKPASVDNASLEAGDRSSRDEDRVSSQGSTAVANHQDVPHAHHQTPHNHHHRHYPPRSDFLDIGLQTSLAIALHKLPEGFITYATNHANPSLGFSIFISLFIHNISDGFALAVPLYLALRSRTRAIFWSSLLGGLSQPLGALLAVIWICATDRTRGGDGSGQLDERTRAIYGSMFALTAGVMTNVALQLFSEAQALGNERSRCIVFTIAGMGIMGISRALTM